MRPGHTALLAAGSRSNDGSNTKLESGQISGGRQLQRYHRERRICGVKNTANKETSGSCIGILSERNNIYEEAKLRWLKH